MSVSWHKWSIRARRVLGAAILVALGVSTSHASGWRDGVGRTATPAEIQAWDIDVRADFAGLPKGSGSAARGQEIWDAQCASCHGVFGESNDVFNPIIGGTTPDDAKVGVVKSLTTSELQRTTMMKLSSLATIWDYIRRAMPWTAPKSLSTDDVYAVTAYILHLADLVPAGFVLSDGNIRETERLLPNRNGMTRNHGMWDVRGKPDVRNTACMKNCDMKVDVKSSIPEYARNAHGNLAEQNRPVGGVRGVDTTRPPGGEIAGTGSGATIAAAAAATGAAATGAAATGAAATGAAATGAAATGAAATGAAAKATASGRQVAMLTLATRHGCMACHGVNHKLVGPAFREVAARHAANGAAPALLAERIRVGSRGQWGTIPMPPQSQLNSSDTQALAKWIAAGALAE